MAEPRWITDGVVHAIHDRQLAEHGGMSDVRDADLLASALARPRHLHAYTDPKPDVAALAASYALGIIKNPPFFAGNKRTGYVLCRTLLKLNGVDIGAADMEKYQTFIGVADGSITEDQLSQWIRSKLVKTR
jgi:death-on-curing protein